MITLLRKGKPAYAQSARDSGIGAARGDIFVVLALATLLIGVFQEQHAAGVLDRGRGMTRLAHGGLPRPRLSQSGRTTTPPACFTHDVAGTADTLFGERALGRCNGLLGPGEDGSIGGVPRRHRDSREAPAAGSASGTASITPGSSWISRPRAVTTASASVAGHGGLHPHIPELKYKYRNTLGIFKQGSGGLELLNSRKIGDLSWGGVAVSSDGKDVLVPSWANGSESPGEGRLWVLTDDKKARIEICSAFATGDGETPCGPWGIATTEDKVYVALANQGAVTVLSKQDGQYKVDYVVDLGDKELFPMGIAATPSGKIYITNNGGHSFSVIEPGSREAKAPIKLEGTCPAGAAADGSFAYLMVSNGDPDDGCFPHSPFARGTGRYVVIRVKGPPGYVAIVPTATDTPRIGSKADFPFGAALTPGGEQLYVTNFVANNVLVFENATGASKPPIPVGHGPTAFGIFIDPGLPGGVK